MITLRNLEKFYAHGVSKTFVLRQISLEVKEEEFLSIMGPSGAGKSTLLHILGMHDSDWTGEFEFAGRGGPRNSDSLLRWDPDQGEGVWNATEATELSC